jgi:hypothetical protein
MQNLTTEAAVLEWNSAQLGTQTPTFQRNLLPPSSGVKREPEDRGNTGAYLQNTQCIPRHSSSNPIQIAYTSQNPF